ncbi:MAG TPA: alpha/beta hydrolase [Roseiflexaceae bacterium]|nr:alpha/beta hydrolase [Roseiflexaceae bacterium]
MNHYAPTLRLAETHLTTGVRLQYAEQGDAAAHPIILLHGITDSWFSFSRVLPALAATYHVFALSQRGHGDSDRPKQGYTMPDFAADVVAFLDALGLERATVVGHSMGSLVAQQVALAAPQRVARLVLIGAAANARNINGASELQEAFDALEDPVPADFAREFQASTAYQPLPDGFLDRMVAESLKVPARVWSAAAAGSLGADYTAQLGRIQAPTLILWGAQDAYFPRAEQDALVGGLAKAVLKVYEDIGHCPHWERPEQFVCDLDAFISQTGAR